jgi:hypothetical protein
MITVDTPIVANYGAMHPERYGKIVRVYEDRALILWNEDGTQIIDLEHIRTDYDNPKGSPIGTYVNCYEV